MYGPLKAMTTISSLYLAAGTSSRRRCGAWQSSLTMSDEHDAVFGVLLAGGLGRRMGGDKFLRQLNGRPLLAHVIERASSQVAGLVINANGDPARFATFALPVAADVVEGFAGPLAGILTGLEWVRAHALGCAWVMSFATDTPFLPRDLVARLMEQVRSERAEIGCAASGGRTHPVFGLWPVALAPSLREALTIEGMRRIDAWTARYRVATVDFPSEPYDPFFNVNKPEDLEEAERLLAPARGRAR
jgi:molybdopterin-guanine dinucleotide biosynthesis protein A